MLRDSRISSIKVKAYIALGCCYFPLPYYLGLIRAGLFILGVVFMILAIFGIYKFSGSKKLLRNYILFLVVTIIGFATTFTIRIMHLDYPMILSYSGLSNEARIIVAIVALISAVALFFLYKCYRELANLTQEKFFLYAVILTITAKIVDYIKPLFFYCTFYGYICYTAAIISIVATIIELIAWIRFKDIKKVA